MHGLAEGGSAWRGGVCCPVICSKLGALVARNCCAGGFCASTSVQVCGRAAACGVRTGVVLPSAARLGKHWGVDGYCMWLVHCSKYAAWTRETACGVVLCSATPVTKTLRLWCALGHCLAGRWCAAATIQHGLGRLHVAWGRVLSCHLQHWFIYSVVWAK